MISFYQCWPERKDLDLNSIEVQRRSFLVSASTMIISGQLFTFCLFVSEFQALELVPRLFVRAGLRRPPKVCSEQHLLEFGSRRLTAGCPIVTEELAPHLWRGKASTRILTLFFLLRLVHISSFPLLQSEFLQVVRACFLKTFGLLG